MAKQGQLITLVLMPTKWAFSKGRPIGKMRCDYSFPKNGRRTSFALPSKTASAGEADVSGSAVGKG